MTKRELITPAATKDLYLPVMAEITDVRSMTPLEKLFEIRLPGGADLGHRPGQFVEVSLFGVGEAPISVSSSPTKKGAFELGIRKVGMLTEMIHRMQPGERIGIRGPFGSGFDILGSEDVAKIGVLRPLFDLGSGYDPAELHAVFVPTEPIVRRVMSEL